MRSPMLGEFMGTLILILLGNGVVQSLFAGGSLLHRKRGAEAAMDALAAPAFRRRPAHLTRSPAAPHGKRQAPMFARGFRIAQMFLEQRSQLSVRLRKIRIE